MAAKGKWQGEPATDKQIKYAMTLITTRLKNANRMDEYNNTKKVLDTKLTPQGNLLTKEYISRMINKLKEMPYFSEHAIIPAETNAEAEKPDVRKAEKPATPKLQIKEGMWVVKEEGKRDLIYKVQTAVYGSGRLYAKQLTLFWDNGIELHKDELAALDDPEVAEGYRKGGQYEGELKAKFVKITGGVRQLEQMALDPKREVRQLKKDEAAQFGLLYGICCVCGRLLTDEKSITAGIGPVCSSKGGW